MHRTAENDRPFGYRARMLVAGLLVAVSALALPGPAVADPAGDASVSADLVNMSRRDHGVRRLIPDPELQVIANRHAHRMAERGYAFHSGTVGGQLSWGWWAWGESVGSGPSVEGVHAGFLDSGSHAATMLSGRYNYLGVGVAYGADGTVYVAQVFGAW